MTSFEQRVARAFPPDEADQDYLRFHLTELGTNWRTAEAALSRSLALAFLAGAVFELLTRGVVAEVSLGFVKLVNAAPLVASALPAVVAYLIFNISILLGDVVLYRNVQSAILRSRFPSSFRNVMNLQLQPPNGFFLVGRFSFTTGRLNRSARLLATTSRFAAFIAIPLGFQVYAHVRLFASTGGGSALTWISVVTSSVLVTAAVVTLLDLLRWNLRWGRHLREEGGHPAAAGPGAAPDPSTAGEPRPGDGAGERRTAADPSRAAEGDAGDRDPNRRSEL